MPEILPIVNAVDGVIGSKERLLVHRDGDVHRVSHVWVYNSSGEVLCHKRSQEVELKPGVWDILVGGHVSFGDSYQETALRELEEEYGLKADEPSLSHLFKDRVDITTPQGKCNKFVDAYAFKYQGSELSLKFDRRAASELKWISLNRLEEIKEDEEQSKDFFGFLIFDKASSGIRKLL